MRAALCRRLHPIYWPGLLLETPIALAAFVMGIQGAMVQALNIPGIVTIALTRTLTLLGKLLV